VVAADGEADGTAPSRLITFCPVPSAPSALAGDDSTLVVLQCGGDDFAGAALSRSTRTTRDFGWQLDAGSATYSLTSGVATAMW